MSIYSRGLGAKGSRLGRGELRQTRASFHLRAWPPRDLRSLGTARGTNISAPSALGSPAGGGNFFLPSRRTERARRILAKADGGLAFEPSADLAPSAAEAIPGLTAGVSQRD
jgi:hypothetical protein